LKLARSRNNVDANAKSERFAATAEPFVPPSADLGKLADAADACRGCWLYKNATQSVFGEGSPSARVMMVGEQPGDKEDQQGHPFVGPAGKLLDGAMDEAGLDRQAVYVTNAVKHFKWEPKGGLRLHKRPTYREVQACYPWLQAEIEIIEPEVIVLLGSTAAQAMFGADFKVTQHRGEFLLAGAKTCFITVHPSSILRARDDETRDAERARFVQELGLVASHLRSHLSGKVSMR
jgi:uracil-DNA glycosylase family protein